MTVRLWGVRGSTPTPQIENLSIGGNTPCITVRSRSNDCVIFDAGTGIRKLGANLIQESAGQPISVSVFLTHFHWDHIQGVPFFAPLYGERNSIRFFTALNGRPLRETLEGQMVQPYFPVNLGQVAAAREFENLNFDDEAKVSGLVVKPFPLNHPQGAAGYRIEADGAAVVYATDYEHGDKEMDRILLEHCQGADILICDSQYTPEEYATHRGWGHSTWENAVYVAHDAGVKQLILFHHDPLHDDATMMRIAEDARLRFENTIAGWEGFVVVL